MFQLIETLNFGSATVNTILYFYTGDFFRNLWGPYAGWAQSVSVTHQYLRVKLSVFTVCAI